MKMNQLFQAKEALDCFLRTDMDALVLRII